MIATWRGAVAAVAVLSSACQLSLATDVSVGRDGSGRFEVAVAVDRDLLTRVEGADLLAGLEGLAEAAPGWEVTRDRPDGGLEVRLAAAFSSPEEFAALVEDFHSGLDGEDARIFDDLRLERRDGGAFAVSGKIGLIPPSSPGASGQGVRFDADDLSRLLAERGEEFVRYDVRVTLPAPPATHDADEVDGASLRWRAPLGQMRSISAVSRPPGTSPWALAGIGAVAAAAAAVTAVAVRRLRRPPG